MKFWVTDHGYLLYRQADNPWFCTCVINFSLVSPKFGYMGKFMLPVELNYFHTRVYRLFGNWKEENSLKKNVAGRGLNLKI